MPAISKSGKLSEVFGSLCAKKSWRKNGRALLADELGSEFRGLISFGAQEVTDPDPEMPNAVQYCTIPNESGQYEINLTDSTGKVVTVFERICILFDEIFDEDVYRVMNTRLLAKQLSSSRFGKYIGGSIVKDIWFEAEFFLKGAPNVSLIKFPCGRISRKCGAWSYAEDHREILGNIPDILPQAHHRGYLHMTYWNRSECP